MPYREFMNCRERIWRANTHRKTFGETWNEFWEDDLYSASLEIDDEGAGEISVYHGYDSLPSIFPLLLGELLYQLRSALDGAVYASAIRESGQDPPPDHQRLAFPICRSVDAFKKARGRIGPLSEERRGIIESVQPYNRGAGRCGSEICRVLEILNEWAIIDRHRRLNVVGSLASGATPKIRIPPPGRLAGPMEVRARPVFLEDDSVVATFAIEGYIPGMKVQVNPDLAIEIAVNEPLGAGSDPPEGLGELLTAMCESVETIVSRLEY